MIFKLSIASLISFILIALDVIFDGLLTKIDHIIFPAIIDYHTNILDMIMVNITTLGNMKSMVIFSILISLVLFSYSTTTTFSYRKKEFFSS